MTAIGDFEALSPMVLLDEVEDALDLDLTGLTHAHPSYINRVYELQATDGTRLIAKFYRPGRWSAAALREEHEFVLGCAAADIPVIAPQPLTTGDTLGCTENGYHFAVYPKTWGRELEVTDDEAWRRLGRILARVHLVGDQAEAPHRVVMHPAHSTRADLELLREGDHVTADVHDDFFATAEELLEMITPLFDDVPLTRIHGDCHAANVLDRPDTGMMLIDFDDMATGPRVQDLWMLLPGKLPEARREFDLIIEGYEDFCVFDWMDIKLIEPLRAMRSFYFWAWCARQTDDPGFRHNFPDWGDQVFWMRELDFLQRQARDIQKQIAEDPFLPA